MNGMRAHHVVGLVVGVLLITWIGAHVLLVVFVSGGLLGYVLGRRHGRHRAILAAAKTIVEERAWAIGSLWHPRDAGTMYPN